MLAEKALEQVNDDELHFSPATESNSIAIIMKHMAGNMLSRWTDFLTTDGEKDWRNRDDEFIDNFTSREEIISYFEMGWSRLFETLETLKEDDLLKTVTIRGKPHTVLQAINRQSTHYAYHIGQIVYLAKHLRSGNWKSLSIPRKKAEETIEEPSRSSQK